MSHKIEKSFNLKHLIIVFTAMMLDFSLLLSGWSYFFTPFSLMTLIYFSTHANRNTYIPTAFVLGLVFDMMMFSLLGAHSMLFSLILFLAIRNRAHFKHYSSIQQAFVVTALLSLYQLFHFFFIAQSVNDQIWMFYLFSPILSGLIWLVSALTMNIFFRPRINSSN